MPHRSTQDPASRFIDWIRPLDVEQLANPGHRHVEIATISGVCESNMSRDINEQQSPRACVFPVRA
jgi:hypothetical protein